MDFILDVPFDERAVVFSIEHIMYLLTVILFVVLFFVFKDKLTENKELFRKVLFRVSLTTFIIFNIWSLVITGFALESGLPIHMCRMATIIGLFYMYTNNMKYFPVLYYMSVFAVIAILYPSNVHPIYTHIVGYTYQVSHLVIVLVWLYGVFIDGYRPTLESMKKIMLGFVIMLLLVWQFNYLVGDGEYLYLRADVNRPFLKSMSDPMWLSFVTVLGFAIMSALTLPFNKRSK